MRERSGGRRDHRSRGDDDESSRAHRRIVARPRADVVRRAAPCSLQPRSMTEEVVRSRCTSCTPRRTNATVVFPFRPISPSRVRFSAISVSPDRQIDPFLSGESATNREDQRYLSLSLFLCSSPRSYVFLQFTRAFSQLLQLITSPRLLQRRHDRAQLSLSRPQMMSRASLFFKRS